MLPEQIHHGSLEHDQVSQKARTQSSKAWTSIVESILKRTKFTGPDLPSPFLCLSAFLNALYWFNQMWQMLHYNWRSPFLLVSNFSHLRMGLLSWHSYLLAACSIFWGCSVWGSCCLIYKWSNPKSNSNERKNTSDSEIMSLVCYWACMRTRTCTTCEHGQLIYALSAPSLKNISTDHILNGLYEM